MCGVLPLFTARTAILYRLQYDVIIQVTFPETRRDSPTQRTLVERGGRPGEGPAHQRSFLVVHNPDRMYNKAWWGSLLMERAVVQLPPTEGVAAGPAAAAAAAAGAPSAGVASAAGKEQPGQRGKRAAGGHMRKLAAAAEKPAERETAAAAAAAAAAALAAEAAAAALPVLETPRVGLATLAPVVSGYLQSLLEAWSRGVSGGRPYIPVPWFAPLVPWVPSFGDGGRVVDAPDSIFSGDNRLQHLCIQVGGWVGGWLGMWRCW